MIFACFLPAASPITQPFSRGVAVCVDAVALMPPKRAIIYNFGVSHNLVNVFVISHHDHRPSK